MNALGWVKRTRWAETNKALARMHNQAVDLRKRLDAAEAELKQLRPAPLGANVTDLRERLMSDDRQRATETKYRALKSRAKTLAEATKIGSDRLRQMAKKPGRTNEDTAELLQVADYLFDPWYLGSIDDVGSGP